MLLAALETSGGLGQDIMIWSVRLAVVCYLLRLVGLVRCLPDRQPTTFQLTAWLLGCGLYILHVAMAFEVVHGWSHGAAVSHTAEETFRVTGIRRGEGVWVNYLFTLVWIIDCVRLANAKLQSKPTSLAIDVAIQLFFAFIVFNATVVFGPAIYRYLALPIGIGFAIAALAHKHRPTN